MADLDLAMHETDGERREHVVVNQLASSQSTAKTMAAYCTLPRPVRVLPIRGDETERRNGVLQPEHYYTARRVSDRCAPEFSSSAVAKMGPKLAKGNPPEDDEQSVESSQRLLYEQNMCTFENFCERRNSERRLQRTGSENHHHEANPVDETVGDGLGNFCTLRNGRRGWRSISGGNGQRREGSNHHPPLGGDYCTLKKKKLQLNRKFVESFLEDPNAQVADYLSELDAYLDEMDGVDDDVVSVEGVESDASDTISTTEPEGNDETTETPETVSMMGPNSGASVGPEQDVCSQSLQYYDPIASGQGEKIGSVRHRLPEEGPDYQEERIRYGDIKHFCTLPKQKRTQFLNAFKRGASLRRTLDGGTSNESETKAANIDDGGSGSRAAVNGFHVNGKCSMFTE